MENRGVRRTGGGGGGNRGGGQAQYAPVQSTRSAQPTRPTSQGAPPVEAFRSMQISQSPPYLINLLVNHFPVRLNNNNNVDVVIYHYEIAFAIALDKKAARGKAVVLSKSVSLSVKRQLFMTDPTRFPAQSAYDGDKNIFSKVPLPTGTFRVTTSCQEYAVTVTLKAELSLNAIASPNVSRNVLHALDVILREKPSANLLVAGRGFYWADLGQDLRRGVRALDGFIQGLRVTEQGLVVYVDYSVMAFRKKMPVIEVLQDTLRMDLRENYALNMQQRAFIDGALRGLRVTVTHRQSAQRYIVRGLTTHDSDNAKFTVDGPDGGSFSVREFFHRKYGLEIRYRRLPCLDLSKNGKENYVPMEFCEIAGGQRFPKQNLNNNEANQLRGIALADPDRRKGSILRTVRSDDGPFVGELLSQCGISINTSMTEVTGRVLRRPELKLCHNENDQFQRYNINRDDGQWNLMRNKVPTGARIDCWAILDFSASTAQRLDSFVQDLVRKLRDNGVQVSPSPPFVMPSSMEVLSDPDHLHQVLHQVARRPQRPQILICPMVERHDGYNMLKLWCDTELGIITQCCLIRHVNNTNFNRRDQYLANLGLLINAKLGGSNAELFEGVPIPADRANEQFMLIGADVNHPSPGSDNSPSIAAVVGSINCPASTRYAARIRAQAHRTEQILDFGDMVRELVDHYARANKGRPHNIIIFRDGVADNQFQMVIDKELLDLREKLGYSPKIAVIVAQKRHHTRLFPREGRASGSSNVPPGTVVDTVVVDQGKPNFYMCSHHGLIGTSKPTHYHVLLDELGFGSDEVQRMIYHLCFTFARCTKPVSLVPPVYYADIAAYRGRVYHEAQMVLLNSRGSNAGSSSLSSPMSLASASGSVSLPKPHKDIENSMFFL
ncbi:Protein argonaute 2 [Acorus gramineus]|uniref:Protein argonaute 2 n=1 Tax=Acorus gramineus TaxID=55184 RepID=A0AAV9B8X0_ACOGR|nr:Protein argonaute 2 [Acorus gramineus]